MSFSEQVLNSLRRQKSLKSFEVRPVSSYEPKNLFFIKKDDDFDFIKSRLLHMKAGFLELLSIDEFKSVNEISSTAVFYFGFLIIINKKAFLYNSIDHSNEVLVELDFSELQNNSHFLFSGEVIALKGINTNGNKILVDQIYDKSVVPLNDCEINLHQDQANTLKIAMISGPFNNSDIHGKTEIFPDLLISELQADFLILLGPIIDRKVILEFDLDPTTVLRNFKDKLKTWKAKSPNRQIILIPSTDDIHTLSIYPCGPYETNPEEKDIIFLSNPSQFYIENTLFSVCTNDLLLEMNSNGFEVGKKQVAEKKPRNDHKWPENSDRIQKLSSHLIYQLSFLPTLKNLHYSVSLSNYDLLNLDLTSDIFITSSKLKTFIYKDNGPFVVANIGKQPQIRNKSVLFIDIDLKEDDFDKKISMKLDQMT